MFIVNSFHCSVCLKNSVIKCQKHIPTGPKIAPGYSCQKDCSFIYSFHKQYA